MLEEGKKTAVFDQHGGDMLKKAAAMTPNTNKGEGRCRDLNILLNILCHIKQQLEIR